MTRAINIDSPRAYRVIINHSWGTRCYGPYSTLGAAKGKRTSETRYNEKARENSWIERTPEGWERVED